MAGSFQKRSRGFGFKHAGGLLTERIRQGAHGRGFAEARLLTQWDTIVGAQIARIVRPVRVSYAKGGIGATLTVTASGANAPVVAMQADAIRDRVNACYGYNAISRVRIDQAASPRGFAEDQASYDPELPEPEPTVTMGVDNVNDTGLRDALARLAGNVIIRNGKKNRSKGNSQ